MIFHLARAARSRVPTLRFVPLFIAAACASPQEPEGVLVGLTSGRTLWITWPNDTAALISEKPHLIVPRDDGMWSAGIAVRCTVGKGSGPWVKDTFIERTDSAFVTRTGGEPRRGPDETTCRETEHDLFELRRNELFGRRRREGRERADLTVAEMRMLIDDRTAYCGIDSLVITFASPTAISLERRTVGSEYCDPARYSTSGENIVTEFGSGNRIPLRSVLAKEASARDQRSPDTLGCGNSGGYTGGRVDSTWSIRRQKGAWVARLWIAGPGVCRSGRETEEAEPVSHAFTGDAPLPMAWDEIVRQIPDAVDAAASPSGKFMLVKRPDTLTLFRPTAAGQIGSPLLQVPVGKHELAMIRWATADETRRWNTTLAAPLPRIERRAEGPVLVLPATMKRALQQAVPGFRPWRQSDYLTEIVQYVRPTDSSALFAAIGDMNGDGRTDVVVQGHDSTRAMLIGLLTEADSVRVLTIEESLITPVDQREPFETFINLVKRGVVDADTTGSGDYNPIPVRIDHEGFEFVYWEKAAAFYYWRGGRFVMWTTSD